MDIGQTNIIATAIPCIALLWQIPKTIENHWKLPKTHRKLNLLANTENYFTDRDKSINYRKLPRTTENYQKLVYGHGKMHNIFSVA